MGDLIYLDMTGASPSGFVNHLQNCQRKSTRNAPERVSGEKVRIVIFPSLDLPVAIPFFHECRIIEPIHLSKRTCLAKKRELV